MGFITNYFLGDLCVCVVSFLLFIYIWLQRRYTYWSKKGVYSPPTEFPAGNIQDILYGTLQIGQAFEKLYLQHRKRPFVGIYMVHKYALMVNDPELIKTILVKEFMHFTDHGLYHSEESEPLEGHLFNINGSRWRNLRVKLMPAFTTGKMKTIFDNVIHFGKILQDHVDVTVAEGKLVDIKETLAKFASDIIATCVFGIDINAINSNSKFRNMSKKSQVLPAFRSFIQSMSLMAPWLVLKLRVSMYQPDVNEFFLEAAKESVKIRKEKDINRGDYLQILMKLWDDRQQFIKSGKEFIEDEDETMTMGDVAAQFFVFFVDGVETSSTAASFALYELARNPDVQETLINEIDEILAKENGQVTYEALSEMKFLYQVVEESLRMYPPLPLVLRVCTKDFKIPNTDVVIDKGTSVMIPIMGIQRDPDIYPDPLKFNPDRFSAENKAARHRFTHLPFGEGPRMCMGNRFGMLMTRMSLVTILSRYTVSLDEKPDEPFKYKTSYFILSPVKGIHIRLTNRNKK